MADRPRYKHEHAQQIIDHALRAQPGASMSHDDLVAIGAEVGLSRAAVEQAALDLRETQLDDAARAEIRAGRRRGLGIHALVFLLVNAFLFLINFLSTPGEWWVLFPVLGWGLGLLFHAVFGLSS